MGEKEETNLSDHPPRIMDLRKKKKKKKK